MWPGGPIGVVLCHGFTSTPASVAPWGEWLADQGHAVRIPLLPGHGTSWRDLNRVSWTQWFDTLSQSVDELAAECDQVVVAGQSLGGALALRLAQERPEVVRAVMLANPAVLLTDPLLKVLPWAKYVVPAIPGVAGDIRKPGGYEVAYRFTPLRAVSTMLDLMSQVRRDLHKVRVPLLVAHSPQDHVVPAESTECVLEHVSSEVVVDLCCSQSFHVVTLDHDAAALFSASSRFLSDFVAGGATV